MVVVLVVAVLGVQVLLIALQQVVQAVIPMGVPQAVQAVLPVMRVQMAAVVVVVTVQPVFHLVVARVVPVLSLQYLLVVLRVLVAVPVVLAALVAPFPNQLLRVAFMVVAVLAVVAVLPTIATAVMVHRVRLSLPIRSTQMLPSLLQL